MAIYGRNRVPNPTFSGGLDGWAEIGTADLELQSGRLLVTTPGGGGAQVTPQFSVTNGAVHRLSFDYDVVTGTPRVYMTGIALSTPFTGKGHLDLLVTTTTALTRPYFSSPTDSAQFFIDNVELREQLSGGIGVALVSQGFKLYVTLVDSAGDQSTISFTLTSLDHAAAVTDSATILTRLAAVSAGAVKSYSIANVFIEDALSLPLTGQVEERATIVAQISGQPLKKTTIHIPAPLGAIFVGAPGTTQYNVVDGSDAAVLAYLETWTLTDGIATISDGEYLDDDVPFVSGRRTHRSSSYG